MKIKLILVLIVLLAGYFLWSTIPSEKEAPAAPTMIEEPKAEEPEYPIYKESPNGKFFYRVHRDYLRDGYNTSCNLEVGSIPNKIIAVLPFSCIYQIGPFVDRLAGWSGNKLVYESGEKTILFDPESENYSVIELPSGWKIVNGIESYDNFVVIGIDSNYKVWQISQKKELENSEIQTAINKGRLYFDRVNNGYLAIDMSDIDNEGNVQYTVRFIDLENKKVIELLKTVTEPPIGRGCGPVKIVSDTKGVVKLFEGNCYQKLNPNSEGILEFELTQ